MNKNNEQDIEIIKLHTKFDAFKKSFDGFLNNDFYHLNKRVIKIEDRLWWILGTIIIGTLITIAIGLFI